MLATLGEFASTLTQPQEISDILHDLAERVTQLLGLAGAGVSLIMDGKISVVTSPDVVLRALERVQEPRKMGPCLASASSREVIAIADLTTSERARAWVRYQECAQKAGIRAVAAIPMVADGKGIGAVGLYSSAPREWSEQDVTTARVLTDVATGYLVQAFEIERQQRLTSQLQRALDSRIVIEQAKGMLAAAKTISIEQAFDALRQHSRDHNANIHELADAIVNDGLRI